MVLDALKSVHVFATILEGLGLLMTAWRVCFRLTIRRFWWEDTWAAILLFIGLLWMAAEWTFWLTNGLASTVSWWIYLIGYMCVVAFARMSILFSIVRIAQGFPHLLKFTHICIALFAVHWVILVTERVWRCTSKSNWHECSSGLTYCTATHQESIFDFTIECIAVFLLVFLPLRVLWRVRLSTRRRRMIISVFASSIILALAALFHFLGRMFDICVMAVAGVHVEVTTSLFVCNLLVVVTYLYRHWIYRRTSPDTAEGTTEDVSSSDSDFTTPATRTTCTAMLLTTVDLSTLSEPSTTESETGTRTGHSR